MFKNIFLTMPLHLFAPFSKLDESHESRPVRWRREELPDIVLMCACHLLNTRESHQNCLHRDCAAHGCVKIWEASGQSFLKLSTKARKSFARKPPKGFGEALGVVVPDARA